ncbi:MAG: cytochrome b [Alphaproteobacteria bacterium]
MCWRNTQNNYGILARFFHWLIAGAVIFMLTLGLTMMDLPNGPAKLTDIGLHKSIGACILVVVALRFLWRQANPVPALPAGMPSWERLGAHASHFALYFMLFAMPLLGWALSSAAGYPVSVFGLVTLPNLVAANKEQAQLFTMLHNRGAYLLIGLISLHALAAFYHHLIRRDTVLTRMLPW